MSQNGHIQSKISQFMGVSNAESRIKKRNSFRIKKNIQQRICYDKSSELSTNWRHTENHLIVDHKKQCQMEDYQDIVFVLKSDEI